MILGMLTTTEDFKACLAAQLFAVDAKAQEARRRSLQIKKRRLLEMGDILALQHMDARKPRRFAFRDVRTAVDAGNVDLAEWVWSRTDVGRPRHLFGKAVKKGRLGVVRWLCQKIPPSVDRVDRLIEKAAFSGQSAVIEWLCEHYGRMGTPYALIRAVSGDQFDVARYLYLRCPANARVLYKSPHARRNMHVFSESNAYVTARYRELQFGHIGLLDTVCKVGNVDMFDYFWEPSMEGRVLYTHKLLKRALSGANSDIVEVLIAHREALEGRIRPLAFVAPSKAKECSTHASRLMRCAIRKDKITNVLALIHVFDVKPTLDDLTTAITFDAGTIAWHFLDKCGLRPNGRIVDALFEHGSADLAMRLMDDKWGAVYTDNHVDAAARNNNASLVAMLCGLCGLKGTVSGLRAAINEGNEEIVRIMLPRHATTEEIEHDLIHAGWLDILTESVWNGWAPCRRTANEASLREAIGACQPEVIRYLCEERHFVFRPDMVPVRVQTLWLNRFVRMMSFIAPGSSDAIDALFYDAVRACCLDLACALAPRCSFAAFLDTNCGPTKASPAPLSPPPERAFVVDCVGYDSLSKRDAFRRVKRVLTLVRYHIDWSSSGLIDWAITHGVVYVMEWLERHNRLEGAMPCAGEIARAFDTCITLDYRRMAEWLLGHGFRPSSVPLAGKRSSAVGDIVRRHLQTI